MNTSLDHTSMICEVGLTIEAFVQYEHLNRIDAAKGETPQSLSRSAVSPEEV